MGTLALDPLGIAGIGAADDLVDEGPIGGQIREVGRGPQQQGIGECTLEVAVRALDRAVLVRHAGVVAGRGHAVVGTQRLVAPGEVVLGGGVEVAKSRRQAVGAMLARRPAEQPQGVLQPLGQGDEALAAEDHVRVLEPRVGEAEVVEPVVEPDADDRDAEIGHVGEVGQPGAPGFMRLAEDDILLFAMKCPPGADPALQGAADAGAEIGMAPDDLLEDRDRAQAGRGLEHRHDLGLEHRSERVWTPAGAGCLAHRWQARVPGDPMPGRPAHRRLGGGHRHGVGLTELHEKPHLVIGHVAAGHGSPPS